MVDLLNSYYFKQILGSYSLVANVILMNLAYFYLVMGFMRLVVHLRPLELFWELYWSNQVALGKRIAKLIVKVSAVCL
jgi:hypothetical protein